MYVGDVEVSVERFGSGRALEDAERYSEFLCELASRIDVKSGCKVVKTWKYKE